MNGLSRFPAHGYKLIQENETALCFSACQKSGGIDVQANELDAVDGAVRHRHPAMPHHSRDARHNGLRLASATVQHAKGCP